MSKAFKYNVLEIKSLKKKHNPKPQDKAKKTKQHWKLTN